MMTSTVFFAEQSHWQGESSTSPCFSQECIRAAAAIMERAQLFRDPCLDFDAFACGRFVQDHAAPDDHYFTNTLISMQDIIFVRLKKLLEDTSSSNRSTAVSKVKTLYNSCMNTSSVEHGSVALLRDLLRDEGGMGAWPALEEPEPLTLQSLGLERRLAVLRVHGVEPFFQLHVGQDEKNASMHVVQIFSSSPVLRSEYYLNDTDDRCRESLRLYRNTMAQAARLLGAKHPERDIDDVVEFEVQFANISHMGDYEGGGGSGAANTTSENQSYDSAMVSVTLAELHEMAPELNWTWLLRSVMDYAEMQHVDEASVNLTIENDSNYLQRFFDLLNRTNPRTVANYLSWRFVLSYMPYLDVHFRRLYQDFRRRVPGPHEERTYLSRWKECVRLLSDGFSMPMAALFVRQDFDVDTDAQVEKLIEEIKNTYVETFPRQRFLDEKTKELCKDKVEAMGQKVGFPKFILDPAELDKEYQGLEIDDDHFLVNILKVRRFEFARDFSKITKPVDKEKEWATNPLVVNAYYDIRGNYAIYPLGILRSPMLTLNRPQYLNFGTIGVVIGHEITHGFAGFGKKFDKHGNFSNWWPDDALEQLRQRAGCFVDQFSQFPLKEPGVYVNGNTTLEENICDSTAVKQAYRAYQRWTSKHGEEPRLPGLGLSNDQVFFVQYAQIWCEVVDEEGYKKYQSELHSPGKYRSNGALQNFDEFARAFHCPLGSPMNPEKKCSLWD
ncbi:neprilysin-1 [Ixodes scapularis]